MFHTGQNISLNKKIFIFILSFLKPVLIKFSDPATVSLELGWKIWPKWESSASLMGEHCSAVCSNRSTRNYLGMFCIQMLGNVAETCSVETSPAKPFARWCCVCRDLEKCVQHVLTLLGIASNSFGKEANAKRNATVWGQKNVLHWRF